MINHIKIKDLMTESPELKNSTITGYRVIEGIIYNELQKYLTSDQNEVVTDKIMNKLKPFLKSLTVK